jgi:hypothetical protein
MNKIICTLAALLVSSHAVAGDEFTVSTGFDYSTGKYGGTTATDILYVPVTGKYESDDWTLKLTVPYISVTGAGGVVQGVGRIGPGRRGGTMMAPTTTTVTTTESGLGDITSSLGYTVYSGDALSLDVVGNLKLGTADQAKGLGTGKNDYSAQVDGYYVFDKSTLFATIGHKVYGSPAGVTLNSVQYFNLGVSQKVSGTTSAGMMIDYAGSPSAASANKEELTAFLSHKISANTKVQANVLLGLANGSPDFGFGATIAVKY